MLGPSGGIIQASLNIFPLKKRIISKNLFPACPSGQEVQYIGYPHPIAPNAGAATALLGVKGDAIQVVHADYSKLGWPRQQVMFCASGRMVARRLDAIEPIHFVAEEIVDVGVLDEPDDVRAGVLQGDVHIGARRLGQGEAIGFDQALEFSGANGGCGQVLGHHPHVEDIVAGELVTKEKVGFGGKALVIFPDHDDVEESIFADDGGKEIIGIG